MPATADNIHQPWCRAENGDSGPCTCGLVPAGAGLTDDQRDALDTKLKRLDAAIAGIEKARRPFDDAIAALQEQRDCTLEDYGVDGDPIGNCAHCGILLLPGDLGHCDSEASLVWCEACAPTWNDVLANYKECENLERVDVEPEDFALGLETAQARVDDGDGDRKHVWELQA